ncbi:MAG: PD40 domain-containing protein [Elusimicrobia bacterium]|nr:PD40 domain-containing protein [Elusimicrobiota bacterium]
MKRTLFAALALGFASAIAAPDAGGAFGRNQVVRRDFDWKIVSTEHFDIHYYEDSAGLVPFAAGILERSYARLSRDLAAGLKERRPFFLYASANDMQQSNIVEVGDGTGGVTEPFKDRFIVYNDGSRHWLDTVASHELTHIFQFRILLSGFWKSARILKSFVYPLWMLEGMAEYFTKEVDRAPGEILMRDAATSGGLIPLWKLEHFSHLKPHQIRLAYESGGSALEFLEAEFGPGGIERMIKLFESRFESSSVLQELVGLDIFAFDRKWREYIEEKYRRVVRIERLKEPSAYGEALTRQKDAIPEQNTSPVFTPDGRRMAYFSTREGYPPALMLQDLRTGRSKRLIAMETRIESVALGNFANLSRVLAISPDGRRLAFFGTKNHQDYLHLYDLEMKRLERFPLPGLSAASQPAFSPDGGSVAFSGMKDGISDIYLYRLGDHAFRQLTSDPQDDQSPAFSPDGSALVYSSELETPEDPMPYQRRLYRLDLASLGLRRLSDVRGAARDPVVSADGGRVLFALEADGFHEIHEIELSSGRLRRLTRSVGASYAPIYVSTSSVENIAFSAQRGGNVHIYMGPRERFLSEDSPRGEGLLQAPFAAAVSTAPPLLSPGRPYKPSYSTDIFIPAFFYSSNGGLFWTSYWQGSDMLGNHQAQGLLTYASGIGYLNYQAAYAYSRFRPKLIFQAVGNMYRSAVDDAGYTVDEAAHAQALTVSYPLDRFHRLELSAADVTDYVYYRDLSQTSKHDSRVGIASFVRDTVTGRYLVATRGNRLRLSCWDAQRILGGNSRYHIGLLEAHQYVPTGGLSALAFRVFGAESFGPDTPQFMLGGIGRMRGIRTSDAVDVGPRIAMGTAEWRFPLWTNLDYYMWYIFPDFYFKAIFGAVFTDSGYVWEDNAQLSRARINEVRHAYGAGLRIHTFILQLFPLVLHFDYARATNQKENIFYVYLGPLF